MPKTNKMAKEANTSIRRLCICAARSPNQPMIDLLNVNQWKFYVVSTVKLDGYKRSEVSITLKSLEALSGGATDYSKLKKQIERAIGVS